jgi:ubiquinone biosynthesis protein
VTALPYLERWMNDRIGFPALKRRLLAEAPYIVAALPELPRLIHQRLLAPASASDETIKELAAAQRARNSLLALLAVLLALIAGLLAWQSQSG